MLASKCGSSTATRLGANYNYPRLNSLYTYNSQDEFVGFVRDPWERYLSGIAQYIIKTPRLKLYSMNKLYDILFKEDLYI